MKAEISESLAASHIKAFSCSSNLIQATVTCRKTSCHLNASTYSQCASNIKFNSSLCSIIYSDRPFFFFLENKKKRQICCYDTSI